MTSIDRTAYPRFKRTMSVREIADVFTPSAAEIEWAQDKTVTAPGMLALVTWLKSFQYLGYFPQLDEVPEPVLAHVRRALGLAESVRAEIDADRTGKRYREIIRLHLGVKSDKAASRAVAEAAVRAAAQSKDNPADLINVAIEHLVRKRLELPGYSTLDRMVARVRAEVNKSVFSTVSCRIPADSRARLDRLLVTDLAIRRSEFDRLKAPARAATIGKLKARPRAVERLARGRGRAPRQQLPAAAGAVLQVPTARCCLRSWTPWTCRRHRRSAAYWTRWSSSGPTGTGAASGSRSPPFTSVTASRSRLPSTLTPSPPSSGRRRCATSAAPATARGRPRTCQVRPRTCQVLRTAAGSGEGNGNTLPS